MVTSNESNLTVPDEESAVERVGETPLGTEFAATEELGLDPLAGAVVGKRFNGGFILIAAVILSAVAGLFSMRKLAQVTAAAGIDTQVEATIDGFLNKLTGTGAGPLAGTENPARTEQEKRVLAVITESYAERQVPLEDVKRDPFILEGEVATTTEPVKLDPEAEAERLARERQEKRDAARENIIAAADRLALKSIVGGSTKMALIDKDIVRAGETVRNAAGDITFRVTAISTSSVDLVAEMPELELTVSVTVYLDR